MDTIITRMQSQNYISIYKHGNGSLRRALFLGLYQGFGPTLIAGIPSSAAFFTIYEASKTAFGKAHDAGYLQEVPQPLISTSSSAAAELVACAISNPAEVLKQNAQVVQSANRQPLSQPPTLKILKLFSKQPSQLWVGYSALVASHLPGICITFGLYESLKTNLVQWRNLDTNNIGQEVKASAFCASIAGGCSSLLFVPIDVVKTRMRLATCEEKPASRLSVDSMSIKVPAIELSRSRRASALAIVHNILRIEGLPGLFRGSGLTVVASAVGSGLYLGCYEGSKRYLCNNSIEQ